MDRLSIRGDATSYGNVHEHVKQRFSELYATSDLDDIVINGKIHSRGGRTNPYVIYENFLMALAAWKTFFTYERLSRKKKPYSMSNFPNRIAGGEPPFRYDEYFEKLEIVDERLNFRKREYEIYFAALYLARNVRTNRNVYHFVKIVIFTQPPPELLKKTNTFVDAKNVTYYEIKKCFKIIVLCDDMKELKRMENYNGKWNLSDISDEIIKVYGLTTT